MLLSPRLLTEESPVACPSNFTEKVLFHLISVTSSIGLLQALLTTSIFFSLSRGSTTAPAGHMFTYFLLKSLDDSAQFFSLALAPIYFTLPSAGVLWYIWFYRYARSVFELSSSFMMCAATFDCYLTVQYGNRFKCCRANSTAYLVAILGHSFSFLFNSFLIFSFDASENTVNISFTNLAFLFLF